MLKTLTFTVMHFIIAFSVAYALTGSIAVGGLVAAVEPLCNSVGFYFHEKIWKRFERDGAPRSPPAQAAPPRLKGYSRGTARGGKDRLERWLQ
ncbi:DUF2061 domain-containing protein [Pseudomonas aeruginosa]|uniref:DUF2061 domain-containing protein n=1 Tax=Pseudomonas aeruginosa TaxID=287 RepID=UPI0039E17CD6